MKLKATLKRQLVYAKDMRYRKGNATYREADACFYEIGLSDEISTDELKNLTEKNNGGDIVLVVNVTKMDNMNVYLYGGKSRSSAFENMTVNNTQITLGQVYNISAYRGLVLVAYPNEDKETEFAFNFWAKAVKKKEEEEVLEAAKWWEFEGKTGSTIFNVLSGIAILMITITCCLCFYNCFLKCKMRKLDREAAAKAKDDENELMTVD